MSKDPADRLDSELKDTVKKMMVQLSRSFDNIPASRVSQKQMLRNVKSPVVPGVKSRDEIIPGPEASPGVPVRIYHPEKQSGILPALLWIHGGGYMFGDLDQDDYTCRQFVRAAECIVIAVDYRLAPENPYPAPLEDCYAALKWLDGHAVELGVDYSRIAVGGASAGGGLASGLALLTRDRGEIELMYQLLVYPMMNDCNVAPASWTVPDSILWTRQANHIGWRAYLGCEPGIDGIPCYASASRAADLKGLPSTFITVGDLDLFAEESVDYARRLIKAGVPVELHVYPGGCHAFDMILPGAAISKKLTADIHYALKRALHS